MTTSRIAALGAGEGPIFGRERGAALLVRGEPGIGESTLLAAVVGTAEDVGMRVLVGVSTTLWARHPLR
jgi:predicted ATP-dependent serine protease